MPGWVGGWRFRGGGLTGDLVLDSGVGLVHAVEGGEVCRHQEGRDLVEIDLDLALAAGAVPEVGNGADGRGLEGFDGRGGLLLPERGREVHGIAPLRRRGDLDVLEEGQDGLGKLACAGRSQLVEGIPSPGGHGVPRMTLRARKGWLATLLGRHEKLPAAEGGEEDGLRRYRPKTFPARWLPVGLVVPGPTEG